MTRRTIKRNGAICAVMFYLGGCSWMGAGDWSKEPVLTPQGNVVTDPLTGRPLMRTQRLSETAAIARASSEAVQAAPAARETTIPSMPDCDGGLTREDVLALKADAQAAEIQRRERCELVRLVVVAVGAVADAMTGDRQTPRQAVAGEYRRMMVAAVDGKTQRSRKRWGVAGTGLVSLGVYKTVDAITGAAVAMVRHGNGDTTVNGMTVNQSTSNNPSAGGGEGAASEFAETETGVESNIVNVGPGAAGVAGERAATTGRGAAMVNGDSSAQVADIDELKAPVGDDQQGQVNEFDDRDGQQSIVDP